MCGCCRLEVRNLTTGPERVEILSEPETQNSQHCHKPFGFDVPSEIINSANPLEASALPTQLSPNALCGCVHINKR